MSRQYLQIEGYPPVDPEDSDMSIVVGVLMDSGFECEAYYDIDGWWVNYGGISVGWQLVRDYEVVEWWNKDQPETRFKLNP